MLGFCLHPGLYVFVCLELKATFPSCTCIKTCLHVSIRWQVMLLKPEYMLRMFRKDSFLLLVFFTIIILFQLHPQVQVYLRSWCFMNWTLKTYILAASDTSATHNDSWFISSLVLIKTAQRNKTIHAPYWNPNYPSTVYLFGLVMLSLAGQGTMQVRYTFVWKVFVEDNPTSC